MKTVQNKPQQTKKRPKMTQNDQKQDKATLNDLN